MSGLGTVVNVVAIIIGGSIGVILKKGLPERFKSTIMQVLGLATIMVGISGVLQGVFKITPEGKLDRIYITGMILCLVIGCILGEFLKIEDNLDKLGAWFQNRFASGESNFSKGFVTASLVYCVGAMAIIGSMEDGLYGKIDTLFAKSMLDGISAIIFSATLGVGVMFSAVSVLLYQGSITLLANLLKPLLSDMVVSQMSIVGSVLILAISFNLLEFRKFKVGNMLPAIFMPLLYSLLISLIEPVWKLFN